MPKLRATLVAAVLAGALAPIAPASAAPPPNDTPPGATVVTGLPFDDAVPIDEATTDELDAMLNQWCGAPAMEGSVWYRVTAPTSDGLIVDVSRSDFSAGALVTAGDPSLGDVRSCGPGAIQFSTTAGETYYVMAFSDTPGITTGTLRIHIDEVPPPIGVSITVNRTGTFDSRTGVATISGTVTCTADALTQVYVEARQRVGRFYVNGTGASDVLACSTTPARWAAQVRSFNGRFGGGKALTVDVGYACDAFSCASDYKEATVQLKGTKR